MVNTELELCDIPLTLDSISPVVHCKAASQ